MFDDNRRDAVAAHGEDWTSGLVPTEVDEANYVWKNPRVSERTDVANGRQVYTILCDDGQEVELKAQIAKLNKKLAKWGQTIEVVAEEEVLKEHWLRGHYVGAEVSDHDRTTGRQSYFDRNIGRNVKRGIIRQVKLTIESPAVAGKKAKLIGAFEAAEDGESVYRHALNGATEADIEPFLGRWRECDHCGYKRDRRASFVCESEDGERVVIGRQCSRDYLGLDAAELLAREAIRKTLASGGEEEEGMGGGYGASYIHVETLVLKAYLVAKRLGGYSRDTSDTFRDHVAALQGAKDYGKSTHYAELRAEYVRWLEKAKPAPMDFSDFADFVFNMSSDFGQNLQIAFSCEYAKPKRRNTIIAGVGVYIGKLAKLKTAAEAVQALPPAKLLAGDVGTKVTFVGTVQKTIPVASDYGPKTLITIVGEDGARCLHPCTGEVKPEAGKSYVIKGTIKKQEPNGRFGPQTTITRATYTPVDTQQPRLL